MPDCKVRIVESYREYRPPFDAAKLVQELLSTVPEKYQRGLDCVLLINQGNLSRRQLKGKVWGRRRKVEKSEVLGLYHHGTRNAKPFIELRIDQIVTGMGKKFVWFPFFRKLIFGHVFFHELGHHIHQTIRPEYSNKEDTADKWSRKLNRNFIRTAYWYALPLIVPIAKIYTLMKRKHWI